MRFDNGLPWGTNSAVPSALALWLVGLGIEPHFGRPRQSTDNGVVERAHGVLNAWVEPEECADFATLQSRLERFSHLQREVYPVREGRSRWELYPQLAHSQRPYQIERDETQWSLAAVWAYVARFRLQRKVEINGRLTILNVECSLGRVYQRRIFAVQLDATCGEWVVYDEYGAELKRFEAKNLTKETIVQLRLASRRQ